MWQKVYNFCLDEYIPLKNLYKFSLIYKHNYAYLKPKKKVNLEKVSLESKLISRTKQTERISFPILSPIYIYIYILALVHVIDYTLIFKFLYRC